MVAGAQSCFTFLAADRESAAWQCATFGPLLDYRPHRTFTAVLPHRPKNRVGVFSGSPSGRLSRRGRGRSINTPGSRACAYKTASGLGKWPNRDPFGEKGFMVIKFPTWDIIVETTLGANIYEMVDNCPVGKFDPFGLSGITTGKGKGHGTPCKVDCAQAEVDCNAAGAVGCGILAITCPWCAVPCAVAVLEGCHALEKRCEEDNKKNGF